MESRPDGGETGPGCGSCLPRALVRIPAEPRRLLRGNRSLWSCSQANGFQRPLVSTEETQLPRARVPDPRGPLEALGGKLVAVVAQVFVRHGQVGGPHAGRVLWEREATVGTGSYLLAVARDTVLAEVLGFLRESEPGQPQQSRTRFQ